METRSAHEHWCRRNEPLRYYRHQQTHSCFGESRPGTCSSLRVCVTNHPQNGDLTGYLRSHGDDKAVKSIHGSTMRA